MKRLIYIIVVNALFVSCVSSVKITQYVDEKTNEALRPIESKEWLEIKEPEYKISKTRSKQIKKQFIPAILYWGWNSTVDCDIKTQVRMQYIQEGIHKAAKELNFKKELNGRNMSIDFSQLPGRFRYVNKADILIFISAQNVPNNRGASSVSYVRESITPTFMDLDYGFEIVDNDKVIYKGRGSIKNSEKIVGSMWKSSKENVYLYMDEYQKACKDMGYQLVAKLIEKIKKNTEISSKTI